MIPYTLLKKKDLKYIPAAVTDLGHQGEGMVKALNHLAGCKYGPVIGANRARDAFLWRCTQLISVGVQANLVVPDISTAGPRVRPQRLEHELRNFSVQHIHAARPATTPGRPARPRGMQTPRACREGS